MPPKMSDRVDVLEAKMANLEVGMGDLQAKFVEMQHSLLHEVAKMLGKMINEPQQGAPSKGRSSSLEEYRMSVQKVELPMFGLPIPRRIRVWVAITIWAVGVRVSPETSMDLLQNICTPGLLRHLWHQRHDRMRGIRRFQWRKLGSSIIYLIRN